MENTMILTVLEQDKIVTFKNKVHPSKCGVTSFKTHWKM